MGFPGERTFSPPGWLTPLDNLQEAIMGYNFLMTIGKNPITRKISNLKKQITKKIQISN